MLKRLYKKGCKQLPVIIDDTQTLKRAKKMQAVGKLHHHATGKYCMGHTILKACLFYRGVTIPLGIVGCISKKNMPATLKFRFGSSPNWPVQVIRDADIPGEIRCYGFV